MDSQVKHGIAKRMTSILAEYEVTISDLNEIFQLVKSNSIIVEKRSFKGRSYRHDIRVTDHPDDHCGIGNEQFG